MINERKQLIKNIMAPYQNKKKDMRAVRNIIFQIHEQCPGFNWVTYRPYYGHDSKQNNQDLSILVEERDGRKTMFSVTNKFGVSCRSL